MGSALPAAGGEVPQVGDLICNKYTITGVLGQGGMGAVFRAVHNVTSKSFALKCLLPEAALSADGRRRMIREARAASRLKHPAIVEIYDIEEDEQGLFLIMELLEGETLHERLVREGPMQAESACALLLPCMRAIARAHAVGIVHRDLKPANIFLCAATDETPEFAKILDFGISRVTDEMNPESLVTASGTLLGTPHYMAPEQLQGRPVRPSSDVYAFGVILYEVLAARKPFEGASLPQLLLNISVAAPAPLHELRPDLSAAFVAVVHRALERDLARRFGSMSEMIEALEAVLSRPESRGASGVARRSVARALRAGEPRRSRVCWGRWASMLAALAVLMAFGWLGRAMLLLRGASSGAERRAAALKDVPRRVQLPESISAATEASSLPSVSPPPASLEPASTHAPATQPMRPDASAPRKAVARKPRQNHPPPAPSAWTDASRSAAPVAEPAPAPAVEARLPDVAGPPGFKLEVSEF